jgi:hypothetical protein
MVSLLLWFLSFLNVWAAVPTLQATPPPVRIVTMGVELAGGSMATLSVRSGDRATARLAKGPTDLPLPCERVSRAICLIRCWLPVGRS